MSCDECKSKGEFQQANSGRLRRLWWVVGVLTMVQMILFCGEAFFGYGKVPLQVVFFHVGWVILYISQDMPLRWKKPNAERLKGEYFVYLLCFFYAFVAFCHVYWKKTMPEYLFENVMFIAGLFFGSNITKWIGDLRFYREKKCDGVKPSAKEENKV